MVRKPSDISQLKVRLPERLRRNIESEAATHDRSMNAEIVSRLERSFQKDEDRLQEVAEVLLAGLDRALVERMLTIRLEQEAEDTDWGAAQQAYREEIELRAQELLAEQMKEKDSK